MTSHHLFTLCVQYKNRGFFLSTRDCVPNDMSKTWIGYTWLLRHMRKINLIEGDVRPEGAFGRCW